MGTQEDLNNTVCAIAYRLVSTIHNCKVLHGLTIQKLTKDNNHLCHEVGELMIQLEDKWDNIKMPDGYQPNSGQVSIQIPIVGGYKNAK